MNITSHQLKASLKSRCTKRTSIRRCIHCGCRSAGSRMATSTNTGSATQKSASHTTDSAMDSACSGVPHANP